MMYYTSFFPYHIFGFVVMVVFWGCVIYAIYMLLNNVIANNAHKKNKPIDILKERYVKGEITKEQFNDMKKDIE